MSQLILYSYFRSSSAYRVRIALNIKKLPHEIRPIHLLKSGGEQHSEAYKKLNPAEQVPTLVEGDFVLSESMAILDYLENAHKGVKLFPTDIKLRAQVLRFCEVINSGIQPLGNLKVTQFLEKKFPNESGLRESWIQNWVGQGLSVIEALLKQHSGSYCFGDQLTAADALLVPQVYSARRFKVDLSSYQNIVRIDEALKKIEAFEKAHPMNQIDAEPV